MTASVPLDTAGIFAKKTSTNALQILAKTTVYALEAWTPTRAYVRQGTPVLIAKSTLMIVQLNHVKTKVPVLTI